LRKILEITGGVCLILIGIAGLILPIMPGWVFIIPGLAVLSRHFDWAKRMVAWAKQKAESMGYRHKTKTETASREP
jgi:uncharacterized membrane protein YbaN (DUF454 family)